MPKMKTNREKVFHHLKVLERKKPGWHGTALLRKVMEESSGGHRISFARENVGPTKDCHHTMIYFKARKIGFLERIPPEGIYLRLVKKPEEINLKETGTQLKKRVTLKGWRDIKVHLVGYHSKTKELIHKEIKLI
ncbi:hypothetical protein K8R43_03775 [archaeon]|nr:hypothetical protein [archaeon]